MFNQKLLLWTRFSTGSLGSPSELVSEGVVGGIRCHRQPPRHCVQASHREVKGRAPSCHLDSEFNVERLEKGIGLRRNKSHMP